jgi:hypothetical protein
MTHEEVKWKNALLKTAGEELIEEPEFFHAEPTEEKKSEWVYDSPRKDILINDSNLEKLLKETKYYFESNRSFKGFFETTLKRKNWVSNGIINETVKDMLPEYKKEASLIYIMKNIIDAVHTFCKSKDPFLELTSLYKVPKFEDYPCHSRLTTDSPFMFNTDYSMVMYSFNLRTDRMKKTVMNKDYEFLMFFVEHIENNKFKTRIVVYGDRSIEFDNDIELDIYKLLQFWTNETFAVFAEAVNAQARYSYIKHNTIKVKASGKEVKVKDPNSLYLEDIWQNV